MAKINTSSIQAIYPLSYMQQGLLLHHLSEGNDQGFLNTECNLSGNFDLDIFKASCAIIVKRHEILRSTIHWKNLEKQVHVIHKTKDIDISYFNWGNLSEVKQKEEWDALKNKYLSEGAQLESGALLKICLVKIKDKEHQLLWPMHHILLDGWSGSLVINDLFKVYNNLSKGISYQLDPLPNYKSYLNWVKSLPETKAKTFWNTYFKGFSKSLLFEDQIPKAQLNSNVATFKTTNFSLSRQATKQLKTYCKTHKITVNTFIQSTWSLVLSRYFNTDDVVHGTTVSGRTADFLGLDLMAGMFMNVQPVRGHINISQELSNWFQTMQKLQFEARNYEHISLDKLYTFFDWSENLTLFDSLVVFENYPQLEEVDENTIKVSNIKSGLTSTYPITLAIVPSDTIDFFLTHNLQSLNKNAAQWIIDTLNQLISLIINGKVTIYADIKENIESYLQHSLVTDQTKNEFDSSKYQAPKNKTELELLQIWEHLLGIKNISTTDNFFEIGGKSLVAVKMFTLINKKLKTKLSATQLLEYPTIATLSNYILEGAETESWEFIVPIKSQGNKTPLFCIHGGGGYVMFFNPLSKSLHKDIPLYALQPAGLNSSTKMHNSIEEMALDYAKEIKAVQPKGPYNILTYCFSPAVGIEIAHIFKKEGDKTNLIVIDSITKQQDFTNPDRIKMRISGFLNRLVNNPVNAISLMMSNNYERFLEPTLIKLFASNTKKNLEKVKQNLIQIYVKYDWRKKHPDDVLLILTKKPDKKLNPIYTKAWKEITKGNVIVNYTKGQHHQLFDNPQVDDIAKIIERELYKF